jgi:hypothetical protein
MSNIAELITFPFATAESRKNFLLGCLAMFAAFFIPLIPTIIVYGYIAKIVRKVADGEAPSMPAWDDFNEMLIDGLRLYGVKLIISLPLLLIVFAGMGTYFVGSMIVVFQDDPNLMNTLFPIIFLVFGVTMCIALPLGIISTLIAYPAAIHAVMKRRFAAGFEIREWWPILRVNFGGFLLAILITYAVSFLCSMGIQILMFTIILICLLPLVMPAIMFYMLLIPELLVAQAYRDGLLKLSTPIEVIQK